MVQAEDPKPSNIKELVKKCQGISFSFSKQTCCKANVLETIWLNLVVVYQQLNKKNTIVRFSLLIQLFQIKTSLNNGYPT